MNQNDSAVLSVHYGRDFGPFGSDLCELVRSGESTVYRYFNFDRSPEIGLWQQPLGAERFEEVVRSLHASGYDRIENPPPRYPGEEPLTLGERSVGEAEPMTRSFPLDQPELTEVTQLIAKLQSEIRKRPVCVLRGRARWLDTEVRADEEVDIEVVFENVGIRPLQISDPMDERQTQPALDLFYLEPSGTQRGFVSLSAADVRDAVPAATGPLVTLSPGQKLTFKVRAHVPVEAGQYKPQLTFTSTARGAEPFGLAGRLDLDLGLVTVLERRAGRAARPDPPELPPLPPLPEGR